MRTLSLFLALLLGADMACAADLYKWVDAEGHVHYTDQPPPPSARSVERKNPKGNLIESDTVPFEVQEVAKKYPVTLYSFPECGDPCTSGEAYLNKRGIPYTMKNQEQDKVALQKLTGGNQIPVLVVGTQSPIKGFQENQWKDILDLAGYPKSNPLGNLKKVPATTAPKPAATGD